MKIVVIVRTRNETHRIAQFCQAYSWADAILVSDGGSDDNTIEIAQTFPNTIFRPFLECEDLENGYWRNNDSDHVNFLIKWAHQLSPDWIILDDCDIRPNFLLKDNARAILESTDCDFVMAVRLYLWGKDTHFPHMAKPGKDHTKWEASLWAWRGNVDFWTVNVPPAFTFRVGEMPIADLRIDQKTLELFPPLCLLHYSWDDEARVEQKLKVYRESGLIKEQLHPLEFAGPLEPLPEWAREEPLDAYEQE